MWTCELIDEPIVQFKIYVNKFNFTNFIFYKEDHNAQDDKVNK